MDTLLDLIPDSTAKKVGKAVFIDHKSKIDAVSAAAKATNSELRDPEKLKEWFGLPDGSSVGTKTVDVKAFRKKFQISITMIDYTKIIKELDKGNKWMESLIKFNPVPKIDKRKKEAEKTFILYGKAIYHLGKDDPEAVRLAEKTFPKVLSLSTELADLHGYFMASKSVFARNQKVFEGYDKMFRDAKNVFEKLLKTVPLPSEIQAELFVHHDCCEKLSAACKKGRDLCKKVTANATKNEKVVKGYRNMMRIWMNQLGETLVPAKLKEGLRAAEASVKPLLGFLKKTVGA